MILKKRQILTASLVLALGAAVFVNWYYTKPQAGVTPAQAEVTATEAAENLGDARYVVSDMSASPDDPFAAARLKREQTHNAVQETLRQTIDDSASPQAAVLKAADALEDLTRRIALETDLETLIEAKTGLQSLVILGETSAEILLPAGERESTVMLQISELAVQKTGLAADCVTIIEAASNT